jgi:hypothetical protein
VRELYDLGGALVEGQVPTRFLPMPQDLRESMVEEVGGQLVDIPTALFRGVNAPVPSVGTSSRAVYAKADLAEDFACRRCRCMPAPSATIAKSAISSSRRLGAD